MAVPICFDVLGTLYGFGEAALALQTAFPRLSSTTAQALVDDWFHSAQRDFTYLSMNGDYTPIASVLKASLPRILLSAGLLASPSAALAFDLTPITSILTRLSARPSLATCSNLLLGSTEPAFRLLAATNGGAEMTRGLFDRALGEEESSRWEVFSCDEIKVAKPAQEVYEAVWKKLGMEKKRTRAAWFVASHSWDLHAAKKAGFQTAWVSYEEHVPLDTLFGAPDIIAVDLEDAARQIIAKEAEKVKVTFM